MTAIIPFTFDRFNIRVIDREDGPWFVLGDVCAVLEIQNAADVSRRLDEDQKGVDQIDTLGGRQTVTIISESGLYDTVLRSDKPQAKPFRKWVTSVVLPQIRKTGSYSAHPMTPAEQNLANAQLAVEFERRAAAIETRQTEIAAVAQEALSIAKFNQDQILIASPDREHRYTMSCYCEHMGAKWPLDVLRMLGKRATRLCGIRGIITGNAEHERWEKGVNTYPVSILKDIFHEYVSELEDYAS